MDTKLEFSIVTKILAFTQIPSFLWEAKLVTVIAVNWEICSTFVV